MPYCALLYSEATRHLAVARLRGAATVLPELPAPTLLRASRWSGGRSRSRLSRVAFDAAFRSRGGGE